MLPSVDLGLMTDHLNSHEGVMNKLKLYTSIVKNNSLKSIITLQTNILRDHVQVMLGLINPNTYNKTELKSFHEQFQHLLHQPQITIQGNEAYPDKWITLESNSTANNMGMVNFFSASMMQDEKVKRIHILMALQNVELQRLYKEIIKHNSWSYTPHASIAEQTDTIHHLHYLLQI
ncbi:hypothetical protein ACFFIS_15180 [Virgibacillus soli]|uniref:Spore coat protein n=1 Tax=Paracerasibacillus soli TaxID=480284 RepID=A0ABU5CV29_9BACI|nr:hypothetical protein [Virgibacillus soli]MDY0410233.1 hypothetical protein [Virgibacillus soli]